MRTREPESTALPSPRPADPTASPRRDGVAVTAVAAVTASGTSVADLFDDLLSGRRPFTGRRIPLVANPLPNSGGPSPAVNENEEEGEAEGEGKGEGERVVYAAHVEGALDLSTAIGTRADRALGRDSRLLMYAMHTTGLDLAGRAERTGVVLGTLRAGRGEYLAIHNAANAAGVPMGPVNPVWGPQAGYNAPAAQLSIHLPARGPNVTLSSGATAGLDAVVEAGRQLSARVCDTVVAAGLDTLCAAPGPLGRPPSGTGQDDDPRRATSPGPVHTPVHAPVPEGEAAALVVLEHAPTAYGNPLAHVLGTGQATAEAADASGGADEAEGPSTGAPGADTLAAAARAAVCEALRDGGRQRAEVGFAVTGSGGDPIAEQVERATLSALFGARLPVCDAVRTTGRTGGADGALAVAVAVEALRRGVVPESPTTHPSRHPSRHQTTAPSTPPSARPAVPLGPLALCLSVEPGGNATAVLLGPGGADRPVRERAAGVS